MQTFATRSIGQKIPKKSNSTARRSTRTGLQNTLGASVQAKLTIGAVNDPAEMEADRVADHVMRMPAPMMSPGSSASPPPSAPNGGGRTGSTPSIINRKCASCEEEEEVQRKPTDSPIMTPPVIRMKATSSDGGGMVPSPSSEAAINGLGSGRPLPTSERSFFEPRFGRDLSNVRIHTGGAADTASKSIGARAFTLGNNIAFANGQYSSGTSSSRHLMAHELTHTVQQKQQGSSSFLQRYICDLTPGGRCDYDPDTPSTPDRISTAERDRRIRAVRRAIVRVRPTYPLAAANIQHWLDGRGRTRVVPLSEFNFAAPDTGIPRALIAEWRPRLQQGVEARLERSHAETLQPRGTERTIRWCDTIRAQPFTSPMESDLAVALGEYVLMSILRIRIRSVSRRETRVEILSWRAQICDVYDFNFGMIAALEVPTARLPEARQLANSLPPNTATVHENMFGLGQNIVALDDDYFREIEHARGAHNYNIYSEEFEPPASVRRDFRIRT